MPGCLQYDNITRGLLTATGPHVCAEWESSLDSSEGWLLTNSDLTRCEILWRHSKHNQL